MDVQHFELFTCFHNTLSTLFKETRLDNASLQQTVKWYNISAIATTFKTPS